jgi:hypothetical protein
MLFLNDCRFNFRPHFAFVEDALDAFILGAAMDVMGLEDINGSPQQLNPNTLVMCGVDHQLLWLQKLAKTIIDKHINLQGYILMFLLTCQSATF